MEDSPAIYWPQRQQPVPDALLRVSREEAQANVQALLSPETVSEFHLVAASGAGDLYAQARLGSQVTHLVRSRDGGKSWVSVWSLKAQYHGLRHTDLPVDILSLAFDPHDPEAVLVGTNAGLFLKGHPLFRPPSTLNVAVLALHPQNPDLFFMATHRLNYGATPSLSGQGLYRARGLEQPNGQVVWEDLSPKLPGQVEEVGFDLKDANRIYIRTFLGGKVYGQTFPDQLRAEDFGWETIAALPPQVQFVPPIEDSPFPLRVPSGYVASLLGYYDIDLSHVFDGYLFSLWGVIFAQSHWTKTGLYSATVFASRDGGFSWGQVGGYYRDDDNLPNPLFLYNSQGQLKVFSGGLPGIAADRIGPWTVDPLDPFTCYMAQQGRGLLYRSQNLGTWEELSQGLDPTLQISGVAVDSLANIYLRTGEGYLRKQGIPHPFRLAEMHLSPDALSAGDEFLISARPLAYAGHQGAFDGTLRAMLGNQSYPLADPEGDGEYTARLRLGLNYPVGFDGVTLFLEVPGQPLARASQRLQFMVLPAEEIPLYQDELAPGWQVHLDAGNLDLNSTRTFAGNAALQLEGQATWEYSGQPIHPFGYLLEFYAAAEDASAIYNLRLDGQSLAQLDAHLETKGSWTRVAVSLERFVREPRVEDRLPKPAFISELHLDSPGSVYLDEIRLVAARPSSLAASWNSAIPDSVVAGVPFKLEATIQLSHFDTTAPPPQASADLSALGGPSRLSLERTGDQTFRLATMLTDTVAGIKTLTLTLSQETQFGPVEKIFTQTVTVLPSADLIVYDEGLGPPWQQGAINRALLDFGAVAPVYQGSKALKIEADSLLPGAGIPSQPLDFPMAGLAAYYPFDGDANDHSGNGNDGTVSGAQPASDRTGLPNSAYHFDGAGDQVEVENSATLDIHGHHSLSICAWVETENALARQGIANKWGPAGAEDDQFNLRLEGDGTIHFQLSDESTEIVSSTTLQANRWYFVAGVYDAEQDQIAIYLDGELDYSKSLHFDITDTQAPLQIGNDGTYWKGRIDEVRLYDRALSAAEILSLYQGTAVRTGIFSVEFLAQHSVATAGYRALHLAFHPGDATASSATGNFELSLNGVGLTSTTSGVPLNMGRKEWQLVEIPLDRLVPGGRAIQSLLLTGNLQGTFYLDEIRLVAARPSVLPSTLVAEAREAALPQSFHLDPNYPNPFNPSTIIRFSLPASVQVKLTLYNLAGQQVATLLSGLRQAGTYTLQWDGRDDQGRELASGVYFYRLQAGTQVETRKLLLLR